MSIRLIAIELYRLEKEVSAIEKELASARDENQDELKDRLRKIKAERNRIKKTLEGAKAEPKYRRPR
jgi:GAF domain-containing protein